MAAASSWSSRNRRKRRRGHAEDLHRRLSYAVGRIARSGDDVAGICDVAVTEMHELTGFDRTMIYRFDHDWHGEVLAERTTGLPSGIWDTISPLRTSRPRHGTFIPAPCCA